MLKTSCLLGLGLLVGCTTSAQADATASGEHHGEAAKKNPQVHTRPYEGDGDAKAETTATATKKKPRGPQIPPPADVAGPPAGAKKTKSGLAYKVLTAGTGASPAGNDSVKVNYTGWTTDGETFDTTDGKQPRTFKVDRVIPGWTEGMQLMKVGEKTRFWIPEKIAYDGKKGAPAGMLVFDVELMDVIAAPKPPQNLEAPAPDAKKTKSGLAYKLLEKGDGGDKPREWDRVKVDYSGWTTDGKMFDSSVAKGRPATFEVNRVIPGWTEGLQLMRVGDSMRFWIPEDLAYKGKQGPQGMLIFDVKILELEKLEKPPPPPKTPKDVKEPPKKATKTASGLAYMVLKKGKGTEHPTKESKVTVHYAGWTTDGKMFDSSITRGKPASFPLGRVIPGWTEGLQLMVEGEKTRFWIPKELAYNDAPGKPAGMLVFDVDLIKIEAAK